MVRKALLLLAAVSLAAVACGEAARSSGPSPTLPPVSTVPIARTPIVGLPPTPDPAIDPSVPEPQVILSPAFISDVNVDLMGAGRVALTLNGDLPTPCHQLRTELGLPDAAGIIVLDAYSVAAADQMCIQVMAPFAATRELDRLGAGDYRVVVSGEEVATFTVTEGLASADPQPTVIEVEA